MSRMICPPSPKVKPTRKTPRPVAPFGQGIGPRTHFRPFAGRMPYTQADLDWAAAAFADDDGAGPGPDWDAMAFETECQARLDAMAASTVSGRCEQCSLPCDDLTFQGLCDRCDDRATDATIAGQNERAGLGYRVF